MPIEMPKGLPFSVDTWSPASARKRHHFLTHAHKDHLSGVASSAAAAAAGPIYATAVTKALSCYYFPQLGDSLFVEIELGEAMVVNDPDGNFTVTAFDANHCMGAVMFLFEGEFGNVLHTGDCRLTPDCLQSLPKKYITQKGRGSSGQLDYLFLDCTFGRCFLKMPRKKSAIQQVLNCIWKHPSATVVYLACDLLGQEEILVEVSKTFGSKIYVDKAINPECFHALSLAAPEILSEDVSSRFQIVEGFPRLYERAREKLAEARANLQPEPLFVRPSTQWYAINDREESSLTQVQKPTLTEAERDEFGVWHVCHSMHSSREELERALQFLQPKWVISTTPSCPALELDYVKKYCFKSQITADDPLWKLLKVSPRKPVSLSKCTALDDSKNSDASAVGALAVSVHHGTLQLENESSHHLQLKIESSPPSRARPITLFGRARLGIDDPDILSEEKKPEPLVKQDISQASSLHWEASGERAPVLKEGSIAVAVKEQMDRQSDRASRFQESRIAERSIQKSEEAGVESDMPCILGPCRSYNPSLRKLYRSRNVRVPQPLPSLVELMSVNKRARIGSSSSSNTINNCYHSFEYSSS